MYQRLATVCTAIVAATVITLQSAHADATTFESGNRQVSLVELYTSEGCSSCPPADEWMSKMTRAGDLWDTHVPLAFHVDYWDYIGWKDLFGDKSYTERQHHHAYRLGMRTVYTPGVFLNGEELRRWRDYSSDIGSDDKPGNLKVTVDGSNVHVEYMPDAGGSVPERLEVTIALLGFDLKTDVERGENAGRTLEHDFVVLGMKTRKLDAKTDNNASAMLTLPTTDHDAGRYGVAAWVSRAHDTEPLQATGGWLADVGR